MQLVVIITVRIICEVCDTGLARPAHQQQADAPTQRTNEPFTLLLACSTLYERGQSSPSTGHSHHIRVFSLDKQMPEAETENNSVFLGHSSLSHKHCSKYNLSRLRGCFTTSLTDVVIS